MWQGALGDWFDQEDAKKVEGGDEDNECERDDHGSVRVDVGVALEGEIKEGDSGTQG